MDIKQTHACFSFSSGLCRRLLYLEGKPWMGATRPPVLSEAPLGRGEGGNHPCGILQIPHWRPTLLVLPHVRYVRTRLINFSLNTLPGKIPLSNLIPT